MRVRTLQHGAISAFALIAVDRRGLSQKADDKDSNFRRSIQPSGLHNQSRLVKIVADLLSATLLDCDHVPDGKAEATSSLIPESELPERLDVIAVGAHPDDVEIACGGTLARMVQQGRRVGIVDLTDGEPTPASPGPEVRIAEAHEAARILGVHKRIILDLPNRRLFDNFEARVALAKVFRRYRPTLVMGIADKTPMASPDHWQAMQITDAAIFYSRLTKWDEVFENLPVHRIQKQIWYPLSLQNLSVPEGGGRFVSDISETLEQKLKAVDAYKTQFPPGKRRVFELVESQNKLLGSTAGFQAGEMLIASTTLGIRDVYETFCAQDPMMQTVTETKNSTT